MGEKQLDNPIVCILAAGRGQRLGSLTSNINKGMLPIHDTAVISRIIWQFPDDAEFVVALGYQKESLREYLEAAHYDRKITFVEVDNFEGEGSGPGHSMACCKDYLQRPFYLTTIDCIVNGDIPDLSDNWIGVSKVYNPLMYSTVKFDEYGQVTDFKNKKPEGHPHAYIGLCGIKDWEVFWDNWHTYTHWTPQPDKEVENVGVFYFHNKFPSLKAVELSWFDTGTREKYVYACNNLIGKGQLGLKKNIDEITYRVGNRILKYCGDEGKHSGRVGRSHFLVGKIPPATYFGKYIYAYQYIEGNDLYNVKNDDDSVGINVEGFAKLLDYLQDSLFNKKVNKTDGFLDECRKFYYDKTFGRLKQYLATRHKNFALPFKINNICCLSVEQLLNRVNWDMCTDGTPIRFHGDLNFGNILYNGERFYLIDWRDCFGACMANGDLYYDLAKLYAGMDMSWFNMKQNRFSVTCHNNIAYYAYEVPKSLEDCKKYYEEWLDSQGYSVVKVKVIAALTMLNMCPLHEEAFQDILYYHSIYRLQELLGAEIPKTTSGVL